jgi:hypothetical protein
MLSYTLIYFYTLIYIDILMEKAIAIRGALKDLCLIAEQYHEYLVDTI